MTRRRPAALSGLPATLKALLAQGIAWAAALALVSFVGVPAQVWALVLTQGVLAAVIAVTLRSDPWWIPIHLGFSPLLLLAHGLRIAPGWYLAAFLVLIAVYWTSFKTRVPLFLSNRATVAALGRLLPAGRELRVLDLGSGTGSLLGPLACLRPDCTFLGIESAPAPYLLGRLRWRRLPNLAFVRGDFFRTSWADRDLIYAFLSPVPMDEVGKKAMREMRPGAMLVSNSFPLPGLQPTEVIDVGDRRGTRLFVYARDSPKHHAGGPEQWN